MKTMLAAVAATAFFVSPALASDLCTPTGGEAKPQDAIIRMLQKKGYQNIRGLEREDGCYEAKAYDMQGKRVEIYVHPNTGEIVRTKGGAS